MRSARSLNRTRSQSLWDGRKCCGGELYNNAVFIDERGVVRGRHHKTHLFGEIDRAYFTPGSHAVTMVPYRGVNIAMMICYDVEFPKMPG